MTSVRPNSSTGSRTLATPPAPGPTLDGVKVVALSQARTYEAVAQWKFERGADEEGGQLLAMADALRRLVAVLDR